MNNNYYGGATASMPQPDFPQPPQYGSYQQDSNNKNNKYDAPSDYGSHDALNQQRYANARSQYKDLWATFLFLIHFIGFVVLSGLGINDIAHGPKQDQNNTNSSTTVPDQQAQSSNSTLNIPPNAAVTFSAIAVVSSFVAALLTAGWVVLMKVAPKQLIKITFLLSILVWVGIAILNFYVRSIFGAVIALIAAGLYALMYFWWRHRIPFSAMILETIADVGNKFPASYFFTFLSLVISLAYQIWWIVSIVGATTYLHHQGSSNGLVYFVTIFLLFSFYWTTQILRNTLFVTISGSVGTWYFLYGTSGMPPNPTLSAAGRAFSTSFGPVAFGSLLVALVQLLRYLVEQAARENSALACIADCILSCIQGLLEYFNDYAYIHVALYGKSFCEAAKDVMNLIRTSGVQAIVNDMLIGPVVSVGAILVGGVAACIAGLWGYLEYKDIWQDAAPFVIIVAVLCFLIGVMMMSIVGMFVQAGASTLFVCIAEQPEALRRTKPELYERVRQLYPQVHWQA